MDIALGYFQDNDEEFTEGDLSKPPSSGIEYLLRVQREAESCPDVVIAKHPQRSSVMVETPGVSLVDKIKTCEAFLPLQRNQIRISADFANLRQKVLYYKTQNIPCDISLPLVSLQDNPDKWSEFCFGNNFHNISQKNKNDDNDDDMDIAHSDLDVGHPPLLSILQNINQPLAVYLLEQHLKYFQNHGFTSQQGHWFFALLLCLDKPTPPEILSLLRDFARQCLHFRDSLTSDHNDLIWQMNLFVVIVSKYFGQADLSLS